MREHICPFFTNKDIERVFLNTNSFERKMNMENKSNFQCPKCGNSDPKFVGFKNGEPYCRKCISFSGESAKPRSVRKGTVTFNLKYRLSKDQQEISKKTVENYKKGINTLINAVCGAGKTELVYGVIAHALSTGKQVGFAVPRRDVAQELFLRIKDVFSSNKVVLVYGDHHKELRGDIVVLTTHQLYRYEKYFGLLIMDEIDAFPYQGNDVLDAMFERAVNGNYVMMSATPSHEVLQHFSRQNHDILHLNKRYHGHELPVPKFIKKIGMGLWFELVNILKSFVQENKPVFIFVPTIQICEYLCGKLIKQVPGGNFVHSQCRDREKRIKDFREGKNSYLVTTAVLERGVTVKNLQVIIYEADHHLYDESTLVQISGRVGRKYDAPEGEVIFLGSKETTAIHNAIEQIKTKNANL